MTPCYCTTCRVTVEPVIVKAPPRDIMFRGEVFNDFCELFAMCRTCGQGFIIAESHDVNLDKLQALHAERMKEKGE